MAVVDPVDERADLEARRHRRDGCEGGDRLPLRAEMVGPEHRVVAPGLDAEHALAPIGGRQRRELHAEAEGMGHRFLLREPGGRALEDQVHRERAERGRGKLAEEAGAGKGRSARRGEHRQRERD